MWVKQCHKPPIWEWFIPPNGDLGDGLLLFTHVIQIHGVGNQSLTIESQHLPTSS